MDQGEPDRAKLNRTGPIQISSKETELSVETTSNQLRVPSLVYSCLSHTFGRNGRNFLSQITAFFGSFSSRFSLFWARKYSNKVYEYKLFPIVVEKFLENIFSKNILKDNSITRRRTTCHKWGFNTDNRALVARRTNQHELKIGKSGIDFKFKFQQRSDNKCSTGTPTGILQSTEWPEGLKEYRTKVISRSRYTDKG